MSFDGRTVEDGGTGPLHYYGGKGSLYPKILSHFPRAESYIEPFFGGGGMFFGIPAGLYRIEMVNDLYKDVVNFMRVLRTRTDELLQQLQFTPRAWDEFKAALVPSDDELESARRFWVRSWQGFAAMPVLLESQWSTCMTTFDIALPIEDKLTKIHGFADRLRHVQIDNRDFGDFLSLRVRPSAFVYADPPYVPDSRAHSASDGVYMHEMSVSDHKRLADSLLEADKLGAKVCVSGYDCPLYAELFPAWRKFQMDLPLRTAMAPNQKTRTVTEVLWMNYPESEEIGERIALIPKASQAKNRSEHNLVLEARRRRVRNG